MPGAALTDLATTPVASGSPVVAVEITPVDDHFVTVGTAPNDWRIHFLAVGKGVSMDARSNGSGVYVDRPRASVGVRSQRLFNALKSTTRRPAS
jgi:hypothetical protein